MSERHDDGTTSWGARLRRERAKPPRSALVASVALHALAVAGLWLAGAGLEPDLPEFVQYKVTLVSPPPTEQGEPEPVEASVPVEVEPPPPEPQVDPPQPEPQTPPPETKPAVTREVEANPDPEPAKGPDPVESKTGGENVDIVQDGRDFPYPLYLENLTLRLHNAFRWNGASDLEVEVVFRIMQDGSVDGIQIRRKSGNFRFDLAAVEAVERVGASRQFGPLPPDWQGEHLWISFTFEPPQR